MNLRTKYTVTESEKNRIRGLHNKAKNLLREDSGYQEGEMCEECGGVHEGACGGDMYEGMGMMCETCGKVHEGACGGGMYEDEDVEAYAELQSDNFDELYEKEGDEAKGGKNRTKGPVQTERDGRVTNPKDQPSCAAFIGGGGGCYYCHGVFQSTPCEEKFDPQDFFNEGKKREMGETALPQGWTMKTATELEDESMMDDIYEVWSGKEDRDSLLNEMRPKKEIVYQLPRRFGSKRLTESQLINMINTITK